jgi:antirestriction protein ArdC
VLLWSAAADRGYRSHFWLTFQQCVKLGAYVRKGERGEPVVYCGKTQKTRQTKAGDEVEDTIRFLKAYVVFNADQVENLPDAFRAPPPLRSIDPLTWHEDWFAKLEIARILTRDIACYIPSRDAIGMPPISAFDSAELYIQTLNHECGHATSAPQRLARNFQQRYGERAYYVEAIVAELCASYLGAHFALQPSHIHDHASYIGHWVELLKQDRRAFLDAAAKAQSAVDWLLTKSPLPATLTEENADVAA